MPYSRIRKTLKLLYLMRVVIRKSILLPALLMFPICSFSQVVGSSYATMVRDTLEISRQIDEYHRNIGIYETNDSLRRHSVPDSLSTLRHRIAVLDSSNKAVTGELSRLRGELFELEGEEKQRDTQLGQISGSGILLLQRRYERNKSILRESLSSINPDTLALIKKTLQEFALLAGYDEYKRDVEHTINLKSLYDDAKGVLATKFEHDKVKRMVEGMKETTRKYKDSEHPHEKEIYSLYVALLWYDYDVLAAKLIIGRVNEETDEMRKKGDKEGCTEKIKNILSQEADYVYDDGIDPFRYRDFLSSSHLDSIPYLNEKWKEYCDGILENPLQNPKSGEEIMSIYQP